MKDRVRGRIGTLKDFNFSSHRFVQLLNTLWKWYGRLECTLMTCWTSRTFIIEYVLRFYSFQMIGQGLGGKSSPGNVPNYKRES